MKIKVTYNVKPKETK